MRGDGGSVGPRVQQYHDMAEHQTLPAAFSSNLGRDKAHLLRQGSEHGLHVGEARLDLDEQQGPMDGVPSQDVDRATLAVHAEGVFGEALPPQAMKLRDDRLDDLRMAAIDEPIGEPSAQSKLEDRLEL